MIYEKTLFERTVENKSSYGETTIYEYNFSVKLVSEVSDETTVLELALYEKALEINFEDDEDLEEYRKTGKSDYVTVKTFRDGKIDLLSKLLALARVMDEGDDFCKRLILEYEDSPVAKSRFNEANVSSEKLLPEIRVRNAQVPEAHAIMLAHWNWLLETGTTKPPQRVAVEDFLAKQ